MGRKITFDANSNILRFVLKNSTTGQGLTGLTSASTGMIISTICDNEATAAVYTVLAGNVETISALGTYAAPTASKCRFKEVDAVNHKGLYEFHFADARFSIASSKTLVISVTGATSLLDSDYEVELTRLDLQDGVRAGLTSLPSAAADAVGGLPISDAGGLDLDTKLANTNEISAARMGALTDWIDGGRLDLLVDAIKTKTDSLTFTSAGKVDANALEISSDATAADNLEAAHDGAGYAGGTIKQVVDAATVLTSVLTEAYAAKSADRTLTKILFNLEALLSRFAIAGTTVTSKNMAGVAVKTYTLDDGTAPTSLTEAT